jgi:hypothetical protein
MIPHNLSTHTRKPLQTQLNNIHKKFDSKMVSHERFLLLQLPARLLKKLSPWRSPLFLLSLSNPKEWNENLTIWDECTLFLLSSQKNFNFFFKSEPKMALRN